MTTGLRRIDAFDLLVALVRARQLEFDQFSGSEFTLQIKSQRSDVSYELRAHRNDNPESLSFYLSYDLVFPWKRHRELQKTAEHMNLSGGSTFSVPIDKSLRLSCPSYLDRKKPEQKAKVVENRLGDALVRMDCGWAAMPIVLHTGKDPAHAVKIARRESYGDT